MRDKFDINQEIKQLNKIVDSSMELFKKFPDDPMIKLSIEQAQYKTEKLQIELTELNTLEKENDYLKLLREHSFYLKFSPTNYKHGTTVSLNSIIKELLPKIQVSYKNFLLLDFKNNFSSYFNYDSKKIQSAFNKTYIDSNLLVSDLNFGSFEIGLCSDPIMSGKKTDIKEIQKWSRKASLNFKENILEIDYDNEKTLNKLIEKYDEKERNLIFKPLIDIIENPKIKFSYKNPKAGGFKPVRILNKKHIEKIIPVKQINENLKIEDKEYEMIQVFAMVEKGKKPKTLKLENTLFDTIQEKYIELTEIDFNNHGYKIPDNINITVEINIATVDNKTSYKAICNDKEYIIIQKKPNIQNAIFELLEIIYPDIKTTFGNNGYK